MAFDLLEPNNTFATAASLSSGTYSLDASDADWFKFNLEPGAFSATMTPSSSADVNMIMYNSQQQIVSANFASGTETISYHASIAGTYYLKIEPTTTLTTGYSLTLTNTISTSNDDVYEAGGGNDSFSRAVDLGTSQATVTNLAAKDDDWFKIELYPGTFELSTPSGLLVEVYSSDQNRIADSLSAGSNSFSFTVTDHDIYYVGVSGGSGQSYSLDLFSRTTWMTTLDYGPVRDASISVFDIDQDGKDEIFVATSKGLDASLNEIRPAALICLEDDGSIKWATSFPAIAGADPQTGKIYQTTSVSTSPAFADLDENGSLEVVIGVGGDTFGEAGSSVVGQPGDKGGVYALKADGSTLWFHQSLDIIGGSLNTGEGRPDGVYGSPVVFDIDSDGVKEVIYNSWDQSTWILDGRTGVSERNIHLADTIWAAPRIADINEDGRFEILVSADITQNTDAKTTTGGIFHVLSATGEQNIAGFNSPVGNPAYTDLRGKWEEQALWSTPTTSDIDGDGHLEIAYGTGNFFHDTRGSYIQVWNHDGNNLFKLSTVGRTFASPLICDLDSDGDKEIIATTLDGYLFAWDHQGNQLFATQTLSYGTTSAEPIFSSPIAVDLNNDGKMEILYAQGSQVVVVDYQGHQLSSPSQHDLVFQQYKGSPVVKDIDADGRLEILSGGTTAPKDQAVVYRWSLEDDIVDQNFLNGRYQLHQSTSNINDFVERFYTTVLSREAEAAGKIYWVDSLSTGTRAGADVARGFIFSQEFTNRALGSEQFLEVLYQAFFNRAADHTGYSYWLDKLQQGMDRSTVLDGFIYSQEFRNLCASYAIAPAK